MASTLVVSVEPALLELVAGSEGTVRVSVENRSQFVGQYQLAAVGVETGWFTFDPDQLGIFPGSSGSATLTIQPPATLAPATYPSVIRVINQNDSADEARALLKLNVVAAPGAQSPSQSGVARSVPPPPPPPETGLHGITPIRPERMPESTPNVPTGAAATSLVVPPFTGVPALRGASAGAGQLEFGLDRTGITVLPGSSQVLNLLVRNNGGAKLSVELSVQGLPPSWYTFGPSALELAPGDAAGSRLTFNPSADAPTGNYPLSLVAVDHDNPANVVQLDLVVEIGEPGALLVEVTPPRAEGQSQAEFAVRVSQSGSSAVQVSLEAADSEDAASYVFDPVSIGVPANGDTRSKLTVRAKKRLTGIDSRSFPFTVTASAAEGLSRSATAQGFFVQRLAPALKLSITPKEQTAPDQATYTLNVANPSQVEVVVKLSAGDDESACRYQFDAPSLTIPAGTDRPSTLTVNPLQLTAAPGQIVHNFTVRAEPVGELLTAAQVSGKYTQTPVDLPLLTVLPASQSSSGGATYTIQVANRRGSPVDLELRAFDEANLVDLRLSPANLRVPAHGQAKARLDARPTSKLLGGEGRRPNDFMVEAKIPGLEQATTAKASLVQVPGFNFTRLLPILLGLLLLLLLCGGAFLVLPPVGAFFGRIINDTLGVVLNLPTPAPPAILNTATPTGTATRTPLPATPTVDLGPFAIKGLTAKVSPTSAASCPASFNFSADITVNRAGSVTYVWEFSNGISTPPKTLSFPGPGAQTVTQNASFNTNGPGGGHVKVTSPPSPDSNQATVVLNCPSAPTSAPGGSTATPTGTPAPAGATFAGSWVHNFGSMTLNQSGASVSGTYYNAFADSNGTIDGTLSGNTLSGNWHINGGTGTIQWTLSGQTFTGTWDGSELWCGGRAGNTLPANCGFSGPWSIRLQGGTRTMNLTQSGASVSGTYFNGIANGAVTGTVSFSGGQIFLLGTWKVAATTGPLKFYLHDGNSNVFQGNYNTTFEWCGWRGSGTQPSPCLK